MSENYVLSATLELKDKLSANIKKANSSFRDFIKGCEGVNPALSGVEQAMGKTGNSARDLLKKTQEAKKGLEGIRGIYLATIKAKDDATSIIKKTQSELNAYKGKVYTAVLNVKQNMGGGGIGNNLKEKASGVAGGMMMGTSIQVAGAAGIGFGIYDAIKNYTDFTAQLSEIKALTGLTGEEMDQVKKKAMALGDATMFSTTDAAKGMTELLKAGIDVKDVLGDASEAAMNLAYAGGIGLPEAAEIMSTAMNAFHVSDATHAADLLAGAANASATDVSDLRYSLAACSAVAAGAGMSFDDTSTALAVLAQNGLKGSDAGTSLKTMLSNLVPKGKTAIETFKQLNLLTANGSSAFFDEAGNMKPLADIAGLLNDRMKNMTKEEKLSTLYDMFGSDALRGGIILLNEGADGVKKMADAMKEFTAKDVAAEKANNLKGALDQLSSSWENLGITILDGKPGNGIRDFVNELTDLVHNFNDVLNSSNMLNAGINSVGKAVKDLKDKFLAFDGVGSIIAGGVLVGGLYKIIKLTKRAAGGIRDLLKDHSSMPNEKSVGSDVGEMVVNARSVIVNGAVSGGYSEGSNSGTTILGPDGKPVKKPTNTGKTPKIPKTPKSNRFGWAKKVPWIGTALYATDSALDIAYAPEGQKGQAVGSALGGLGGMWAGAKIGAAGGAAIGSVIPGIGTAVGGAVGGIVGGIGGGIFGDQLGSWIGEHTDDIKAKWNEVSQTYADSQTAQVEATWKSNEAMSDSVSSFIDSAGAKWDELKTGASSNLTELENWADSVWNDIDNNCASAMDDVGNWFSEASADAKSTWTTVSDWFDENVWEPLKSHAQSAWSDISTTAGGIKTSASSAWDTYVAPHLPHFATGVTNFEGGLAEINESGRGEIVDLPTGSRVYPHETTKRIIQQQLNSSTASAPVVNVTGNTFVVREEADINKIAYELSKIMTRVNVNWGGAY